MPQSTTGKQIQVIFSTHISIVLCIHEWNESQNPWNLYFIDFDIMQAWGMGESYKQRAGMVEIHQKTSHEKYVNSQGLKTCLFQEIGGYL